MIEGLSQSELSFYSLASPLMIALALNRVIFPDARTNAFAFGVLEGVFCALITYQNHESVVRAVLGFCFLSIFAGTVIYFGVRFIEKRSP